MMLLVVKLSTTIDAYVGGTRKVTLLVNVTSFFRFNGVYITDSDVPKVASLLCPGNPRFDVKANVSLLQSPKEYFPLNNRFVVGCVDDSVIRFESYTLLITIRSLF